MADKIQVRRDTAANWTAANPTLAQGELGWEIDNERIKVGDGSTAWNSLDYKFESTVVEAPAGTFTFTGEDGTITTWVIAAGGGENNTASNVGSGGVGLFKQKAAADLEFKNINAGSNKISITDDVGNNEVDIDINSANINTGDLNNDANFIPDAPANGSEYARKDNAWTVVTGGGGVTDHTLLTNIGINTHGQIDTHIASTSNPHSVTATQLGLGNVDNTSDANKPVSVAQQSALNLKYDTSNPANYIDSAGAPVQPADIADFETTTQLNVRDTNNRDRANHTGTQLANTISDFAATVRSTILTGYSVGTNAAIAATDTILQAFGKIQGQIDAINTTLSSVIFGTEAEDFQNLANVNVTTGTLFAARTFTTASKPTGRYRVAVNVHLKPGSSSSNYLLQLRIDGTQIGLEAEVEGKDSGSDIRVPEYFVGYFDHTGPGTFDIEVWAATESGTMIIHGVTAEVWRVSL